MQDMEHNKIFWISISDFLQVQANFVTSVRLVASIKIVALITAVLSRLLAMTMVDIKNVRQKSNDPWS